METVWGIPAENLTLKGAYQYLDTYAQAIINDVEIENDISSNAKSLLNKFWWFYFYRGMYGNSLVAQLTASTFLNYIIDNFNGKVKAHEGSEGVSEFHKNIRHVYFSAHDTTVAGMIAAIKQQDAQESLPPLASLTLIELFKKNNKYYLKWTIDDKVLRIGNHCDSSGN